MPDGTGNERGFGIPLTDAERRERHFALYGTEELPERGAGLGQVLAGQEAVDARPGDDIALLPGTDNWITYWGPTGTPEEVFESLIGVTDVSVFRLNYQTGVWLFWTSVEGPAKTLTQIEQGGEYMVTVAEEAIWRVQGAPAPSWLGVLALGVGVGLVGMIMYKASRRS